MLVFAWFQVDANGRVSLPSGNKKTMEMIGQRLFTGRVAVAQAALTFAETLFATTRAFADGKACWTPSPSRRPPLSKVPQIGAIFTRSQQQLGELSKFMKAIEAELSACLRADTIPPLALQQAIAVGKVKAVEGSIELCFALKQEVGSYALMAGTGFEQLDFLQCCKFAEGDSRILMQKMARDIVRSGAANASEAAALKTLQAAVGQAAKGNGGDKAAAWDACWQQVYQLAEAHMQAILAKHGVKTQQLSARL